MAIFLSNTRIRVFFLLFFIFCQASTLTGQTEFISIRSFYDDSAREWNIETSDFDATLYLKWPLRNDWNEWVIDYEDKFIRIQKKWTNPPVWQLHDGLYDLAISQKWRGDDNLWIIDYRDQKFEWSTAEYGDSNVWFMNTSDSTYFDVWTEFPQDSRDWLIEDTSPMLPEMVKFAALFITVYLSSPRF